MGTILVRSTKTTRLVSLIILCCLSTVRPISVFAGGIGRSEISLNEGWAFHFGTMAPEEAAINSVAADWTRINLPHTWNAIDGADGGGDYARGSAWYVRHFKLDPTWAHRRVFIQFDGGNRSAKVFLNGRQIGEHVGGFARFRFDLTEDLKPDVENVLAVQVNNAPDGTMPVSADFTFFGGLYRGVKLFCLDPLHVEVMDFASDGIYVTPRKVSAARADFSVAALIRNDSTRVENALVRLIVRDALGNAVITREQTKELAPHGEVRCEQEFSLERPRLWNGRQDPYQYRMEVSVITGGEVRDLASSRFGLRSFHVDPDKGFFLNGAHLDLHGVSRHQDRAGKGWAVTAEDECEDFAMIEEIGATAIRVAHYPQSPLWFDLADERGLVLWAEIPLVNEVLATDLFTENARQQLRELIRQNYNRPAICFWGVGNETREVGESSGHAQPNGPVSDKLIAELAQLAHAEDPSRLSTYASHHRPDDTRNFHTDVLGFNKYFGWYGGVAEDFAPWVDGVHQRLPTLRFSMSEYGAGGNILQHDASGQKPAPGGAMHPEEYQNRFHEVYWQAMSARDFIWGKFVWNMFDFASDARAEGEAPGLNDKGLVTYDRKIRKDAFFWYKANWSTEPVVYITSRRFARRPAGKAEIKVYSNATEVELFLNGVSCGTVTTDTRIFRWNVELAVGHNQVMAHAVVGPATLTDECGFTGLAETKL